MLKRATAKFKVQKIKDGRSGNNNQKKNKNKTLKV